LKIYRAGAGDLVEWFLLTYLLNTVNKVFIMAHEHVFILDLGITEDGPRIYEFGPEDSGSSGWDKVRDHRDKPRPSADQMIESFWEERGAWQYAGNRDDAHDVLLAAVVRDKGLEHLALHKFIPEVVPRTRAVKLKSRGFTDKDKDQMRRFFPGGEVVVKTEADFAGRGVATARIDTINEAIEGSQRLSYMRDIQGSGVIQELIKPKPIEHEGKMYAPTVRVFIGVWQDETGAWQREYFCSYYKIPNEPLSDTFSREAMVSNIDGPVGALPVPADVQEKLYKDLDQKFLPGLHKFFATPVKEILSNPEDAAVYERHMTTLKLLPNVPEELKKAAEECRDYIDENWIEVDRQPWV
jgi:hypothetical protein